MTIEEKAKAYDEALERAIEFQKSKDGLCVLTAESIFPELRESEDEQTRRQLIEFISDIKRISESGRESWAIREGDIEMCNAFLAYLEKQKEQKPAEKQDYSGLNDLERAIHRGFLSAGVENVPVTIIKETAKECLEIEKSAEQDYDNRIQYDSVKSGIEAFASTYSFNIESKLFPQLTKEQQRLWREEIEQAVIAGGEDGAELARDNRYKENRITEWSEEDELMRTAVIQTLKMFGGRGTTGMQIDWLKSLRPQPKQEWSDEDKEMLDSTIKFVEHSAFSTIGKGKNNVLAWLKSLRPQPSWKFIEEQEEPEYYQHFDPDC